jgi:hypothetical protein
MNDGRPSTIPKIDGPTRVGLGVDPSPQARVEAYRERAAELGVAVSCICRPFTGAGHSFRADSG